ncbi:fumarylacetoacetate hydrolase family protein [Rhodococcus ruber]|uniref:Fumarylacetoacetate hydrolase family protein n=1 Tax=Rhodococcus ruber TaxID=1830 RepID=A0ABT4MM68_9NOCA|nr:fumarylacetoacetate hydrolase family protein [Rhodococcus ruber]MCZ4521764.1 fumarylacetoacetate hydrolase family protein [Rhodococcus ruber]
MRIANMHDRAFLVLGESDAETAVDIAEVSNGKFGPDLSSIYENWDSLTSWFSEQDLDTLATANGTAIDRAALGAPSPTPRQVFAAGLNYREHASESGFDAPTDATPPLFTKYVSSFSGPDTEVVLPPGGAVDWEVELVVIIGRIAHAIEAGDAWAHIAGLTAGQDISERILQKQGPAPQFGLGKSLPGFSPQGPWLVTADAIAHPDDLELGCAIDGEEVQKGRTKDLIYSIPTLVAALSHIVTLYPGDVIFTGTPSGVGIGRSPQRFLQPGERLDSWIEGIGELHQRFVAAPSTP